MIAAFGSVDPEWLEFLERCAESPTADPDAVAQTLELERAVRRVLAPRDATPEPFTPWLTRKQAARRLGLSLRKFDADVRRSLPAYQIGKSVRFKSEEIDRWLDTQKVGGSSAGAASTVYASRTKVAATRSPRAREILKRLRS